MKKSGVVLLMLVLAIMSCKNTKNAQTDPLTEQEQKNAMRREALEANPLQKVEVDKKIEKENQERVKTETNSFPDSLVARIERTACYGSCPIYTISVYNTGFASYEGVNFVENKGYFGAYISRNVINTLQNMAKEIGFMQFQEVYDEEGITDIPSTITSMRIDGQLKTVKNRYAGPMQLEEFEKFFDSLFKEVDWDDDYKDPNAD